MEQKIQNKLSEITATMYNSIMGQLKAGYYAMWHPYIVELTEQLEYLADTYATVVRGEILEEQYQSVLEYQRECSTLEDMVFEHGEIERMEYVLKEITDLLQSIKDTLANGVSAYENLEDTFQDVYAWEAEFVKTSQNMVEEYKTKIRNRMNKNVEKVRQFEKLGEDERRYFMTHVILFDEGKLEHTILSYLTEAEHKIEEAFEKVEQKAVIVGIQMAAAQKTEYIQNFREKEGKGNPGEFRASKRLQEEDDVENKFEKWFESLLGSDSKVGQLINEKGKKHDFSMEERIIDAVENVVNSNLGELQLKDMIEAYKEECAALKENSFGEFFGEYKEVKKLVSIIENMQSVFLSWEIRNVGIADIILSE